MKERIRFLALMLAMIFAFMACRQSEQGITLRVAFRGNYERAAIKAGLEPWIQENGIGVDVIWVDGDWPEYLTKIQLMVANGEALDLVHSASEGFEMLINLGLALPIDGWIEDNRETFDEFARDAMPGFIEALNFGGQQFGLPDNWNNIVTHINLNLLEEAGLEPPLENWDTETFLHYAKSMTKIREDGTKQFGVFVPNYYFAFQGWVFNNNTTFMSEDYTESNLLDPKVAEIYQLMYDLIYVHEVAPIPEPGMDDVQMLARGDVGMIWAGRWPVNRYIELGFHDVMINYVPQFHPGTNYMNAGVGSFFTLRNSKHVDEAVKLAIFLSSPQFMETDSIPVLRSVAEQLVPATGVPQNYELFFKHTATIKPLEAPTQYNMVATLIHRTLSDTLVNRRDVASVLREAHTELNMILSDNR